MFHRPKAEEVPATQDAKADVKPAEQAKPAQQEIQKPAAPVSYGSPVSPNTTHVEIKPPAAAAPVETKQEFKPEEKKMTSKEEQDKLQGRTLDIPSQAYQPQAATAPRAPGSYGYPGATSAPSQSSAFGSQVETKLSNGRRLVIGQGITMSGEIEACDHLTVEGTVEAALKGASILEIAESGVFYGTVEIDEATIAGRFEGDITVGGRLTITSTGSVTGSVAYKELAVEAGATVDGKLTPLASKGVKKVERPKKSGHRNDNAGEGSELPFTSSFAG